MKKKFTDEQFDIADKLIKSAYIKETAEDSMMRGIFRRRKVSDPKAEKEIEDEVKFISSTLANMPCEEKFDILDCVSKLGQYYSRLGMLESFEKGPLNHYTYLSRCSIAVYEIYYDKMLDGLLEKLKGKYEYSERQAELSDIKAIFSKMDKRDKSCVIGRLRCRIEKSNKITKKPETFEQFQQANENLAICRTLKSITSKEQESSLEM